MPELDTLLDQLIETSPPADDPTGETTFDALNTLRRIRNIVDHQIVTHTAQLDAIGVAQKTGGTTRKLLIEMGHAPASVNRIMRSVDGLPALPALARHAADGRLSTEVADAIVRGMSHIGTRCPGGLPMEPDGSDDRRTAEQCRADAFELILDQAALGATIDTAGPPRTQLVLTIPATGADPATLPWTGSISQATARQISCDGTLTEIVLDGEGVPLQMGQARRLFPAHLRRAVIVRDSCCIKCGASPSYTQVHHLRHWADGGPTDLDNGCLLCQRCHTQVHHHGWDVVMGFDRHPWLVPPASIDPHRRPLPAYNRRTMRLDDAA